VVLHHLREQVHELRRERLWLIPVVHLPELIGLIAVEPLVMDVSWLSLSEWRVTSMHDEEDDSQGEEVSLLSRICFASVQLWGHVGLSAELGLEVALTVASSKRGCEPEVSDFYVVILVHQDIFRLQISVRDSIRVAIVQG